MKLNKLTTELVVTSVEKSISFYEENLGLEVTNKVEGEGKLVWALLENKERTIAIMLTLPTEVVKDVEAYSGGNGGVILYVDVEDISGIYANFSEKENLCMKLRTTFYGAQEFAVFDPDGYIIMFAESAN